MFAGTDLAALETHGFLELTLSPATRELIAQIYDLGRAFFRLPLDQKLRDSLQPTEFGYRPVGVEYSQSPDRSDPMESFSTSIRTRELSERLRSDEAILLQRHLIEVIEPLEGIAEGLLSTIAETLGGALVLGSCRRWSSIQLNYSRPSRVTGPFIHERHEDGHALTLATATGPGLELEREDGSYLQTDSHSDRIIVMPGDILWLLSGGRIRPLYHRVISSLGLDERMALLFFADPDPTSCSPWISTDTNAGIDIGARVLTNGERYGLAGFEPD